jgi:hypothetical protein
MNKNKWGYKWDHISTFDIQNYGKVSNCIKKVVTERRNQYLSEMILKGEM